MVLKKYHCHRANLRRWNLPSNYSRLQRNRFALSVAGKSPSIVLYTQFSSSTILNHFQIFHISQFPRFYPLLHFQFFHLLWVLTSAQLGKVCRLPPCLLPWGRFSQPNVYLKGFIAISMEGSFWMQETNHLFTDYFTFPLRLQSLVGPSF